MRAKLALTLTLTAATASLAPSAAVAGTSGGGIGPMLPAVMIARALLNAATPDASEDDISEDEQASTLEVRAAMSPPADELDMEPMTEGAVSADFEFQYDPAAEAELATFEPLPEPLPATTDTPEELPSEQPAEATPRPEREPVAVVQLPPDPYFGGVARMLGAAGEQPLLPLEAIRSPIAPQWLGGQLMAIDPLGRAITPVAELPEISDGELLNFHTTRGGDRVGRAMLLTKDRAMLLEPREWTDELVVAPLPQLQLARPTFARVLLCRPDGAVSDWADFMLVPTAAE